MTSPRRLAMKTFFILCIVALVFFVALYFSLFRYQAAPLHQNSAQIAADVLGISVHDIITTHLMEWENWIIYTGTAVTSENYEHFLLIFQSFGPFPLYQLCANTSNFSYPAHTAVTRYGFQSYALKITENELTIYDHDGALVGQVSATP